MLQNAQQGRGWGGVSKSVYIRLDACYVYVWHVCWLLQFSSQYCRCTCKQLRSHMKVVSTSRTLTLILHVLRSGTLVMLRISKQHNVHITHTHTRTYPVSGRTHRTSSASPLREPQPPTPAPVTPHHSDSGLPGNIQKKKKQLIKVWWLMKMF